ARAVSQWRLETSPQFEKAARKLDRQVLRRVKTYRDELCFLDDPRARGEGLTGDGWLLALSDRGLPRYS
ncbi:type II toxin-antitoxin system RelE family toxin, partial [Corynebacterium glyciniphilum]|uniref:type II toxin-antitoxin system RelE family toxin n=1 Tax=Corynebacterium glyciniphilum TaxID=1404244 RepID=UPI003FD6B2B0